MGSSIEDFIAKAAEVDAAVGRVRAQGAAALGRVRVEVAADGRITELRIADELRAHDGEVLARLIREAHDMALAEAGGKVDQLRADFANDPHVERLARELGSAEDGRPAMNSKGMTGAEMDSFYERLRQDPLGRNPAVKRSPIWDQLPEPASLWPPSMRENVSALAREAEISLML